MNALERLSTTFDEVSVHNHTHSQPTAYPEEQAQLVTTSTRKSAPNCPPVSRPALTQDDVTHPRSTLLTSALGLLGASAPVLTATDPSEPAHGAKAVALVKLLTFVNQTNDGVIVCFTVSRFRMKQTTSIEYIMTVTYGYGRLHRSSS
ncbi:hypothetical protein J6590_054393 [Homalodisca vitripennis]|nr:hypothetical protein J6590_054393 [Homalodisca vitripennis]